ncbi:MAG: hypothetical protein PBU97_05865 [Stenotrophomonas maltophilia]
MAPSNTSFLHGWRLFVAVAVVLIAFALAAFAPYPDAAEGSRAAIRVTARTSFLLFLAAFTASSFASLLPGPFTRFLLRERRIIGLSFAFSHLLHAVAITGFGVLNPAFWPARSALANLPGTVGYIAILALAITSHRGHRPAHGTDRLASPARHRHVDHRGGVYLLVLQARSGQLLVCGAVGAAVHRLRGALDCQAGAGAAPKCACAAAAAEFEGRS